MYSRETVTQQLVCAARSARDVRCRDTMAVDPRAVEPGVAHAAIMVEQGSEVPARMGPGFITVISMLRPGMSLRLIIESVMFISGNVCSRVCGIWWRGAPWRAQFAVVDDATCARDNKVSDSH